MGIHVTSVCVDGQEKALRFHIEVEPEGLAARGVRFIPSPLEVGAVVLDDVCGPLIPIAAAKEAR